MYNPYYKAMKPYKVWSSPQGALMRLTLGCALLPLQPSGAKNWSISEQNVKDKSCF